MKKIVALAALLVLATMPSVPQRAYACPTANCATDDSTATQVPAAMDQTGKAQTDSAATACPTPQCATPEPEPVQVACPNPQCATPEPAPTQVAGPCTGPNCATPEPAPTQVATTPQVTTRRERWPA
jgi:hypothetical protein